MKRTVSRTVLRPEQPLSPAPVCRDAHPGDFAYLPAEVSGPRDTTLRVAEGAQGGGRSAVRFGGGLNSH